MFSFFYHTLFFPFLFSSRVEVNQVSKNRTDGRSVAVSVAQESQRTYRNISGDKVQCCSFLFLYFYLVFLSFVLNAVCAYCFMCLFLCSCMCNMRLCRRLNI